MEKFEIELLEYLGFGARKTFFHKSYDELKEYYGVEELKTEHENKMLADFGPVVFCKEFPSFTSPFWNMRRKNKEYADLLYNLFGQERVEKELNEFLSLKFFPRCGGGIGMTRIIAANEKLKESR